MDGNADNPFPWFTSNDPVPAVSLADLRSMWAMHGPAANANASGQSTATDICLFEHVCRPGADVQAVLYRVWMLWMLAGPMNMLSPWLRDGELADAVFEVCGGVPYGENVCRCRP